MKFIHVFIAAIVVSLFISCGGNQKFVKNPVDDLIKEMTYDSVFSIILYDMNVEGTYSKSFMHQYRIVSEKNGVPQDNITDWYPVSKEFFLRHEQHMGMEIVSKTKDGKVSKSAAPPGYSNYVGNPQYGRWVNRSGSSFWEFYGKYAMLSSVFNMFAYPVNRAYWNDYRTNYRGSGRTYYGPTSNTGRRMYGTYGDYTSKTRSNSRYTNSNTFKNRVRSQVSRSTGSRSRSGYSSSSRTSRSGSRYSSGSSYRSRGGGYGK